MDTIVQSIGHAQQAKAELDAFRAQCAGIEEKYNAQRKSLLTLIEAAVEHNGGKPIMDSRRNIAYFRTKHASPKTVVNERLLDAVRAITPAKVRQAWQALAGTGEPASFAKAVCACLKAELELLCCGTVRQLVVTNRRPADLGPIEPRPVGPEIAERITEYLRVDSSLRQVRKHKRTAFSACAQQQAKSTAEVTQLLTTAIERSGPAAVVPSTISLVPGAGNAKKITVLPAAGKTVEASVPPEDLPPLPPLLAAEAAKSVAAKSEAAKSESAAAESDGDESEDDEMVMSVPGLSDSVSIVGLSRSESSCSTAAGNKRKSAGQSPKIAEFFTQLRDDDLALPPVTSAAEVDRVWNSDFVTQLEAALLSANARIKQEVGARRVTTKIAKPRLVFKKKR
jgi:hypothetical protein